VLSAIEHGAGGSPREGDCTTHRHHRARRCMGHSRCSGGECASLAVGHAISHADLGAGVCQTRRERLLATCVVLQVLLRLVPFQVRCASASDQQHAASRGGTPECDKHNTAWAWHIPFTPAHTRPSEGPVVTQCLGSSAWLRALDSCRISCGQTPAQWPEARTNQWSRSECMPVTFRAA